MKGDAAGAAQPAGTLLVRRPGACLTVQDLGRPGFGRWGVGPSGAMDPLAHRVANRLLGNDDGAPTLEITGPGADLQFRGPLLISLAGADLGAALNGQPLLGEGAWLTTLLIEREARLTFTRRRRGFRSYLAVTGGWQAPRIFGSAATDLGGGLGGLDGRGAPLRPGDQLGPASHLTLPALRRLAAAAGPPGVALAAALAPLLLPASPPAFELRFVPEDDAGLPPGAEAFASLLWKVTARSGRTGYHLQGPATWLPPGKPDRRDRPSPDRSGQRLSEPTAAGAIQLPPDGAPILLMADRNPTGGYPRLGHLAQADRGRAGQLAPGDSVRFLPVATGPAVQLLRASEAQLLAALAGYPLTPASRVRLIRA